MNRKTTTILFFLIVVGGILRFYNLTWGSPFYFHPDERNIAYAVTHLSFPALMDPHFYAYGSLVLYVIYFTTVFVNLLLFHGVLTHVNSVSFEQAIVISRFYSALLSLLLIPSTYFIGWKLFTKRVGLIAAVFTTFSVGYIQFAHFGTFEMWLTFLGLWFFYYSFLIIREKTIQTIVSTSYLLGLLIGVKVSSITLVPILLLAILIAYWGNFVKKNYLAKYLLSIGLAISIIVLVAALVTPFFFLNSHAFVESIQYESSVALGTLPVFYTGEFYNTIPIVFQLLHIFPFLVSPFILILFLLSLPYCIFLGVKRKQIVFLFLLFTFFTVLISQGFLFVKWTRYMVPVLPFLYIITAFAVDKIIDKSKQTITQTFLKTLTVALIIFSILYAVAFFIVVYLSPDTRIQAAKWATEHIPTQTPLLSEVYDLGIITFNPDFPRITLFNFYELETNNFTDQGNNLAHLLSNSDFIILPSQRIAKIRIENKHMFPVGNMVYTKLFSEKLGYNKVYETPCNTLCRFVYIGDPARTFEETATVFDRPTIYIFKNTMHYSETKLRKLL